MNNLVVERDSVCTLCEEFLSGEGRPLTLVESGRMEPMRKDPSFLKFVPDDQDADDTVVEEVLFHTECIVEHALEAGWCGAMPGRCDACGERFLHDIPRYAFRMRSGDVFDGTFAVDPKPANMAVLCTECFRYLLDGELD
jgi:hypothetical protein